jgi:hypothetical protein
MICAYLGYLSFAGEFARELDSARFEPSQDLEQNIKPALCRNVGRMSTQAAGRS